ncbi:hypothetical protein K491DRAFT_400477 [Lophiostoma macrostomum CBS 122681]|uniref:Uncharacterized protein n=1 Tax=Lophiostoma macrostomum CBS 122681 TaxID=1314788 RepID=A0A6A6TB43_9PLEO|nr:hypothetical protein K491DRAFT_400477 [Lophiostoma macrostomum CBS 122681]
MSTNTNSFSGPDEGADISNLLSLIANYIQIFTGVLLLFTACVWRLAVVQQACIETESLYLEANSRAHLWSSQMEAIDTAVSKDTQQALRNDTESTTGLNQVAQSALRAARPHLEQFQTLVGDLRRRVLGGRHGIVSRLKSLFLGYRYLQKRDELKALLERVRTLMGLAGGMIDHQEKRETNARLHAIYTQLGISEAAESEILVDESNLQKQERATICGSCDDLKAQVSIMQAYISYLEKGEQ